MGRTAKCWNHVFPVQVRSIDHLKVLEDLQKKVKFSDLQRCSSTTQGNRWLALTKILDFIWNIWTFSNQGDPHPWGEQLRLDDQGVGAWHSWRPGGAADPFQFEVHYPDFSLGCAWGVGSRFWSKIPIRFLAWLCLEAPGSPDWFRQGTKTLPSPFSGAWIEQGMQPIIWKPLQLCVGSWIWPKRLQSQKTERATVRKQEINELTDEDNW